MDWAWLRYILYLPDPASDQAVSIDTLHFFVIGTTMLGATLVFATALWFVFKYRRREGSNATRHIQSSTALEMGNASFLLGLFILFWVVGFAQYGTMQEPPEDAMDVYVTAKQWMWKFAQPRVPGTVGYLVIPEKRPVRMVITSRDVVHSFYVPNFRLKQDAVPGRYTSMWLDARQVGVYPIYCAEYCGLSHSRMAADLVVLSEADYEAYLHGRIPPLVAEAMENARARGIDEIVPTEPRNQVARGRMLVEQHACVTCHTLDGRDAVGPSWLGLYHSMQPLDDGSEVYVDDAYIARSIEDPRAQVARGFRSVMPTYYGDRLDAQDIEDITALIRSLGTTERRVTEEAL